MTVAAVLAAVALLEAAAVGTLFRALRSQARQHGRREDLLLDRVMHLTGQTWTPPPADLLEPTSRPAREPRHYTQTPEQLPVH